MPDAEVDDKNMPLTDALPSSSIARIAAAAMIDIYAETLLDLRQACRLPVFLNPRTKQPLHISGIYRHIKRGARAANGERIRLEVIRTPTGLRTSREAVGRFIVALTNPTPFAPISQCASRKRQIAQAEAELMAAGFELAGGQKQKP
jgi:hypothetical protein